MSVLVKDQERYISNCEFSLSSELDPSFEFNIKDFANVIINNYWGKSYALNNGTSIYRILKAKLIKNYLIIYMQYTNTAASDPAFADINNGKSRTVRKNINEGVACSAHLVIDINPTKIPNKFNAVLEDMLGLPCSVVSGLINHITSIYSVTDSNNIAHKPKVKLNFYAKNNFKEQLNKGKISAIIAYRDELKLSSAMDDDTTKIFYKEVNRLEFKAPSTVSNIITFIAKAAKIARERNFNKVKVTHKYKNKQQSATYKINKNIIDDNMLYEDICLSPFVSKEYIGLKNPVGICDNKWNSEIIREMINYIMKV